MGVHVLLPPGVMYNGTNHFWQRTTGLRLYHKTAKMVIIRNMCKNITQHFWEKGIMIIIQPTSVSIILYISEVKERLCVIHSQPIQASQTSQPLSSLKPWYFVNEKEILTIQLPCNIIIYNRLILCMRPGMRT